MGRERDGRMNESLTVSERFSLLREAIDKDLVCRGSWEKVEEDGRRLACLLLTIAPETRDCDYEGHPTFDAGRCPASVLPMWLAILTPWIDDSPSEEAWPDILRRYADVVGRAADRFDPFDWERVEHRVRKACIIEARSCIEDIEVHQICDRAIVLCDRAALGDEPSDRDFRVVQDAAEAFSAAMEILIDDDNCTSSKKWIVPVHVRAYACVASDVVDSVACAIARTADGPEEAVRNFSIDADRMCHAIFDVIEAELAAS